MKQLLKNIAFAALAFVLCVSQAWLSMGEYKEGLSADNPTGGSFSSDVWFFSLFAILFFMIPCILLRNAKTIYKAVLLTIDYMLVCFWVNDYLFDTWHAAWTTYTLIEELLAVAYQSYIFIVASAALFCFSFIGIDRISKNNGD